MPGYIQKALLQSKHQTPKAKQNSPHPYVKPHYGAKAQYATNEDTSPPQQRGGIICARSSRHITLLRQGCGQHNPPCTECSCYRTSKSVEENESNNKTTVRLLRNTGQSSTCIQSKQNDSCRHRVAGYCDKKKLQSQAGGHIFLSNNDEFPPNNGAILTVATIIKAVMS